LVSSYYTIQKKERLFVQQNLLGETMKPLTRPMKAVSLLGPNGDHSDDSILNALKQLKKWPKIATLKVDGIRAIRTTDLMSCRNKMIPNESIRIRSMSLPYGFDCELYNSELQYDKIESIVMSEEHEDSQLIYFHPIDLYDEADYIYRLQRAFRYGTANMQYTTCHTAYTLMDCFLSYEQSNGEGICFRTPDSPYKQGHSTLKEEYLIKLCRYVREEVTIVEAYEQMANSNALRSTSQGLTERSKCQAFQTGKGTLGGFLVENSSGQRFKVGTGVGLTEQRRQYIWDNLDLYIGKEITIKHKPHGKKVLPRSPIMVGLRDTNII